MNLAAHLAAEAGPGELLVTDHAAEVAGLDTAGIEHRHVSLKGRPADAFVLRAS
jgi:class 3 adenylate cyclase